MLSFAQSQSTATNCNNGCLMCSSSGNCLLCDFQSFYIKNGLTCILNPIEGCSLTIEGKTCYKCANTHYLDTDTKKCVKVTTMIENCLFHKSTTLCDQCNAHYYLNASGQCIQIQKQILNCYIYESDTICKECARSTPNTNKTACVSPTNPDNCAFFSGALSCTTCKSGFIHLSNKYLWDLQDDRKFLKSFFNYTIYDTLYNIWEFQTKTNVCVAEIPYCAKGSFNECTECQTGYFVNSSLKCQQNPQEKINNCLVYLKKAQCTECMQGYWLESATSCKQQTAIAQCLKYSITQKDYCDECGDQFYFKESSKLCQSRETQVSNCETNQSNSELCKKCRASFIVSQDFKSCLNEIPQCLSYLFLPNSDGSLTMICNVCLDGFYIYTEVVNSTLKTSCRLPEKTIEGCLKYQNETLCSECENNFYLALFKCHFHQKTITEKLSCSQFSNILLNQCVKCTDSRFLFQLFNYCENQATLIDKCYQYNESQKCAQCDQGYYIVTDAEGKQTCTKSTIESCVTMDTSTNKCTSCDFAKKLHVNVNTVANACVKIPTFNEAQCVDFKQNLTASSFTCDSCAAPYYPFNFKNNKYSFCTLKTEISTFGAGFSDSEFDKLTGCLAFAFSTKKCLVCNWTIETEYISSDGLCVSKCNNDQFAITFNFSGTAPTHYLQCVSYSSYTIEGSSKELCKRIDKNATSISTAKTEESTIPWRCAECLANHKAVATGTLTYQYTHYYYKPLKIITTSEIKFLSYFSAFNKVPLVDKCVEITKDTNNLFRFTNAAAIKGDDDALLGSYGTFSTITFTVSLTSTVFGEYFDNCEFVLEYPRQFAGGNTSNVYGCASCKFGFTGPVVQFEEVTSANAAVTTQDKIDKQFLHHCSAISECNTNLFYNGLGSHDDNGFMGYSVTCHVCKTTSNLVSFVAREIYTMKNMKVTETPNAAATAPSTSGDPKRSSNMNWCGGPGLSISGLDTASTFPQNCQIQQLVSSRKLTAYGGTVDPNPLCVACKPKYRPTVANNLVLGLHGQVYKYIKTCELITYCSTSATMNKCDLCSTGYVLLYDAAKRGYTAGESCVTSQVSNCVVGETNGKCHRCKLGFVLNPKGICDDVEAATCTVQSMYTPLSSAYLSLTIWPFP